MCQLRPEESVEAANLKEDVVNPLPCFAPTAPCTSGALGVVSSAGAPALADAHTKPLFLVRRGDLSFLVTSPDQAAAGRDPNSTHVLVAPHGRVSQGKSMKCTVTELSRRQRRRPRLLPRRRGELGRRLAGIRHGGPASYAQSNASGGGL
jgi:hypothetical protein